MAIVPVESVEHTPVLRLSPDIPTVKLRESLLNGGLSPEMLDVSLLVLLGYDAMLMCTAGVD